MGLVDQAEYLYRQAAAADPATRSRWWGWAALRIEQDDEDQASSRRSGRQRVTENTGRMIEPARGRLARGGAPIPVEPSDDTATDGQATQLPRR